MEYILNINKINRSDSNIAGFKAVDIAELHRKKINIPICFVIKSDLFEYFLNRNNLRESINRLLKDVNMQDEDSLQEIYKKIEYLIMNIDFPSNVEEELMDAYETLAIDLDHINIAKLVTSIEKPYLTIIASPNYINDWNNNEGIFQNVKGKAALYSTIKATWASLYSPRAIKYQKANDITNASISIIIQRMINTQISAQMTVDESEVVVHTFFGFQDYNDELGKDEIIMTKNHLEIKSNKVNFQACQFSRDLKDGFLIKKDLKEDGETQKLNDKDVEELGRIAKKIETFLEKPVKVFSSINKGKIYTLFVNRITKIEVPTKKPEEQPVEVENISLEDDIAFLDNIEKFEKQEETEAKPETNFQETKKEEQTNGLVDEEEYHEKEEDNDYIEPQIPIPEEKEDKKTEENWNIFDEKADEIRLTKNENYEMEKEEKLPEFDTNKKIEIEDTKKKEVKEEELQESVLEEPKEHDTQTPSKQKKIEINMDNEEIIDSFDDEDKISNEDIEEKIMKKENKEPEENSTTDDFIFSEMTKETDKPFIKKTEAMPLNISENKEEDWKELEEEIKTFPKDNLDEAHRMIKQIAIISYNEIFNALKRKYTKVTGRESSSFDDIIDDLKKNDIRIPFEKELKKIKKIKEHSDKDEEIEIEESTMALRTANNFLSIFE